MQKIIPCLWFDKQAEEVAKFYITIFNNSKIGRIARHDESSSRVAGQPDGSILTIEFEIDGYNFLGLNGGPHFKINPSISFFLNFDPSNDNNARENLDMVWNKLSDGGTAFMPLNKYPFSERYGWLQDKYGVSWQLILSKPEGDNRPFIVPSFLFANDVYGKTEEARILYFFIHEFETRNNCPLSHRNGT